MRIAFAALIAWLAPLPAQADTAVYTGTLGKSAIVVELTADPVDPDVAPAGRYFYRAKGIDIPLQADGRKGATIAMTEEDACDAERCGEGQTPPVAAVWSLTVSKDGRGLTGTWKGKRTFPIALTLAGSRRDDEGETPFDLHDASDSLTYGVDMPITRETAPYDLLRLDVPLTEDAAQGWPDARFRYVHDPRTKFPSPRIVSLTGADPRSANAMLADRHWRDNLGAFSCAAMQYAGFTEGGTLWGSDAGTFGGYEDIGVGVTALTPALMSWRESGSLFCGGAHPANYSNAYVMDVKAGRILLLGDMFADATDYKPGAALADFVRARRVKATAQTDIDFEAECGTDELIGEYLAASLVREGDRLTLVFGLQGLPHAIVACGDDVLTMPAAEAAGLFTPAFAALLK